MIAHVYIRTAMANNIQKTYVATCDVEIYDYIVGIGGNAVMTSDCHERASDRTAEAVSIIEKETGEKVDAVAMIQGDEPLVNPDDIDMAISILKGDATLNIVNLMSNIDSLEGFQDKNEVKVVTDLNSNALFFSREPIPSSWHSEKGALMRKQLGLIFFRREYLEVYNLLEPTPLEELESIDMLRVIEHGDKVKMKLSEYKSIGVDTKNDAKEAETLLKEDALFAKIKNTNIVDLVNNSYE